MRTPPRDEDVQLPALLEEYFARFATRDQALGLDELTALTDGGVMDRSQLFLEETARGGGRHIVD